MELAESNHEVGVHMLRNHVATEVHFELQREMAALVGQLRVLEQANANHEVRVHLRIFIIILAKILSV